MVLSRIMTVFQYHLSGSLNFTHLHIMGAAFTLGTLYLLWKAFKDTRLNAWYFLPVTFLLFQLQYHLIFLWAICSHQHQTVVFCACLSMFLLARGKTGWGIFFAVWTTFCMGNGVFIWPAGIVVLFLSMRYKHLAVWCLAAVLAIAFYFSGLPAQGNESSFDFFAQYPHLSFLGFFAFLGGLFDFFPAWDIFSRSVLPVLFGFIIMIWVGIWLVRLFIAWVETTQSVSLRVPAWLNVWKGKRPDSFQLFLTGVMTFLLVNAFIIALLRPRFGFFVMIVSNYKLYPALFLVVAYLAFLSSPLSEQARRKFFKASLFLAIGIWTLSAYTYLPVIAERNKYLSVNGYNQEFNGYGLGHVPFSPHAKYVDSLFKEMGKAGLYLFPEEGKTLAEKAKSLPVKSSGGVLSVEEVQDGVLFSDPERGVSLNKETGQYAFLRNGQRTYLFKLEPKVYTGRNFLHLYEKKSEAFAPYASLIPGSYEAGILRTENGFPSGLAFRKVVVPERR